MVKSSKQRLGKRGETMLEVILSLAVFGITMVMITTMLGVASRVYVKNYELEKSIDKQINALNTEDMKEIDDTSQDYVFSYWLMESGRKIDDNDVDDKIKKEVAINITAFKGKAQDSETYLVKFKEIESK